MHIQNFKIYIDLIETGSFTLAAQRNNITQSAVSQIVKMIEDKYGVVLVERGRKKFSVTPEGQIFEQVARQMMELHEGIFDRLHELGDVVAGKLRISTVYSIGLHELPDKLRLFRQTHPEVEVIVDYKRSVLIYDDVMEGRADIGLVSFPQHRKGLMADVFNEDAMVCICSPTHRLAKKKKMKLAELQDEAFISFEPDTPTRRAIDQVLKKAGVTFREQQEFDNMETVKRAVEVAGVVSIVPRRTVDKEVAAGSLIAIKLEDCDLKRPLGILRKQSRLTTPAMREFMSVLRGA
jgi:LysR family transcriptional regulator, transcriptional activator of the cysJI operon